MEGRKGHIYNVLSALCMGVVSCVLCGCDGITHRMEIMGDYASSYEESFDDGMECKVKWDYEEKFGFMSVVGEADMYMTFMFSDQFEFKDLVLEYDVSVEGDWDYDGDSLTVMVDTATFKLDYVKSNATRYTEESMVRYLRKHVVTEFLPSMRSKFMSMSDRSVKVVSVSDSAVVVEDPRNGEPITMPKQVN